jgi:ABC-type sugar transport system ATPase subunit
VDIGARSQIYAFLTDYVRTTARTCAVLVTTDLDEATQAVDRLLVMSHGRIVGEFLGDEITEDAVLAAATTDGGGS